MRTFAELAAHAVERAPNPDWKGRGRLDIGPTHVKQIVTFGLDGKERSVGEAHVVAVRFEIPHENKWNPAYPFTGFFLARLRDTDLYETSPIIGDFGKKVADEREYQGTANTLAGRLCPSCGGLDTVKRGRVRAGRDYVVIRSRCSRCGWTDEDIVD